MNETIADFKARIAAKMRGAPAESCQSKGRIKLQKMLTLQPGEPGYRYYPSSESRKGRNVGR